MPVHFRDRAIAAQGGEPLRQRVRVVALSAWVALGLALLILLAGAVWLFVGQVAITVDGSGTVVNAPANVPVTAAVQGTITGAQAAVGSRVREGDRLASLRVAGGATVIPVSAPVTGTIVGIGAGDGAAVSAGDRLATIAPDSPTMVAYLYVPEAAGGQVRPGMLVHLLPNSADPTVDGYLTGSVAAVSPLPVPVSRIAYVLADETSALRVVSDGPVVEVTVALETDPSTPTGYAWTDPRGPAQPLVSGVPATGDVVVKQVAPLWAFLAG